jgi:hemerythrin-like domain-containing protein
MSRKSSQRTQAPDAIDLLTEDHETVQQLFSEFDQMKDEEEDEDNKRYVVELTCAELSIHAQIEEELFYPALREALEEQDVLDEAEVEHDVAKQLIAELESMSPDEELYDAKFTVLGEYVRHHIQEEENEIFPKARKSGVDLEALAVDILDRKEELRAEYGLEDEEEEDEELESGYAPQESDERGHRPRA